MTNRIRRNRRQHLALALCLGLSLAAALPAPASADPYKVNAGDVLQINVYGDASLSGRFAVDQDGVITYPLVGNVAVAGMTMQEIGKVLGKALAERIPGASVTVAIGEYAPVFVVGEVRNPGRYQFRPGMITLELVAMAGGVSRIESPIDTSGLQLITMRQDYLDLDLQIFAERARRQRLRAELDGTDLAFTAPEDPDPDLRRTHQQILNGESELFAMRKKTLASEQDALTAQENSYADEARTIRQSMVLHDQEIALLNQDVEAARKLADRGLTAGSNLRLAERQLSATRRDALELESYLARAEQNRLAIAQRRASLVEERQNEAASSIQEIDLNVARMLKRQQALLASMAEVAASAHQTADLSNARQTVMTVLRSTDGVTYQEVSADDRSQIKPGDILRVTFAMPLPARQVNSN